ncbi:MAG: hypothetical protein IJ757_00545 [Clostridiales bacterium]|nr:hypothetical protein [Clostridiales bacterium]
MSNFRFGTQNPIPYRDGNYGIDVRLSGHGNISTENDVTEDEQNLIKAKAIHALQVALSNISAQGASCLELQRYVSQINQSITEALAKDGYKCHVVMANIMPDEVSRQLIDKYKRAAAVTNPAAADLAMRNEAMRAQMVAQSAQPQVMAQAAVGVQAAVAANRPKFCTNCGAPTGPAGKFCSNCGSQLF